MGLRSGTGVDGAAQPTGLALSAESPAERQRMALAALRRFAPFCLAIPILFMSYRFGWQGPLLATLFNGVVLVANEPPQKRR